MTTCDGQVLSAVEARRAETIPRDGWDASFIMIQRTIYKDICSNDLRNKYAPVTVYYDSFHYVWKYMCEDAYFTDVINNILYVEIYRKGVDNI